MGWSQIFLKIEFERGGVIDGECEFLGHEREIVLMDFDWGMAAQRDFRKEKGNVQRRIKVEPVKLSKRFDSASVSLLKCMEASDLVKRATITVAHSLDAEKGTSRKVFSIDIERARLEKIDLDMRSDGKAMVLQEDLVLADAEVLRIEYVPHSVQGQQVKRAAPVSFEIRSLPEEADLSGLSDMFS